MTTGGFSSKRLARVRDVLERHVDSGYASGAVAISPVKASLRGTKRPTPGCVRRRAAAARP